MREELVSKIYQTFELESRGNFAAAFLRNVCISRVAADIAAFVAVGQVTLQPACNFRCSEMTLSLD